MNLTEKLVEAVKDCFSERGIALHVSTDDLTEAIRSVLEQEDPEDAEIDELTKKAREAVETLRTYSAKLGVGINLSIPLPTPPTT